MHTGEAVERSGDYYGPTVNRAARIRSLAQAGWVTVSHATVELVRPGLPAGLSLAALGPQARRGIEQPEPIFLLVDAEAPVAVDAIEAGRTADSWAPAPRRVNARSAPFSGRAAELAELAERARPRHVTYHEPRRQDLDVPMAMARTPMWWRCPESSRLAP